MHDSRHHTVEIFHLVLPHANVAHGSRENVEFLLIVDPVGLVGGSAQRVVFGLFELEICALPRPQPHGQKVIHVVRAFIFVDFDNARFFQEVVGDGGTHEFSINVKVHLREFSKTRRVVIASCLCVSKSFQDGITFQNDLFQSGNFALAQTGQIAHDQF
eukprot:Lithocolla_globosa_v1_NODE_554_length_3759_cov_40.501080.p2 type:complete len:159 gc:universal NODE_554_length_3759_cov_40.501080:1384-908(-)